jgi:hypothetical protein
VREAVDAGADVQALLAGERGAVAAFGDARRAWLLYPR